VPGRRLDLAVHKWSEAVTQTVLEGQRSLSAVMGVAAMVVLVSARRISSFLGALTVAITLVCGYGLLTRLLPDHFGRFDPIGAGSAS